MVKTCIPKKLDWNFFYMFPNNLSIFVHLPWGTICIFFIMLILQDNILKLGAGTSFGCLGGANASPPRNFLPPRGFLRGGGKINEDLAILSMENTIYFTTPKEFLGGGKIN